MKKLMILCAALLSLAYSEPIDEITEINNVLSSHKAPRNYEEMRKLVKRETGISIESRTSYAWNCEENKVCSIPDSAMPHREYFVSVSDSDYQNWEGWGMYLREGNYPSEMIFSASFDTGDNDISNVWLIDDSDEKTEFTICTNSCVTCVDILAKNDIVTYCGKAKSVRIGGGASFYEIRI